MLLRSPSSLALAIALPLVGSVAGCATETESTTTTEDGSGTSAALLIRPVEFMGDVPCSAAPGAMRSYVVTVIDHLTVNDPDTGEVVAEYSFTLASSIATSCAVGVRFDDIAELHSYTVQVDGYEASPDELCPEGCWVDGETTDKLQRVSRQSGIREQVLLADGTPAVPRWSASCGTGDNDPTIAAATGTTLVGGCTKLVDLSDAPKVTAVTLDPLAALGTLECAGFAGKGVPGVAAIDVTSEDGLPGYTNVACDGAPKPLVFEGLTPGGVYTFFLAARAEQDGPVTWGATCTAVAEEGLTVGAQCTPLTADGAVKIDLDASLGLVCGQDFATYDAKFVTVDDTFAKAAIPCSTKLTVSPVPAGEYAADVAILGEDGVVKLEIACDGAVSPGRVSTATCSPK